MISCLSYQIASQKRMKRTVFSWRKLTMTKTTCKWWYIDLQLQNKAKLRDYF